MIFLPGFRRLFAAPVLGSLCFFSSVSGAYGQASSSAAIHGSVATQPSNSERPIALPLAFEQNRGQAGGQALYLAHSQDGLVVFAQDQVMLPCSGHEAALTIHGDGHSLGPDAEQPTGGVANYYRGNDRTKWIESIPLERQVRYRQVAEGVDLVFHGRDGRLEYDVEVAPGADPGTISLSADSGSRFAIQQDGSAVPVSVDGKSCAGLRLRPPVAYQQIGGRRVEVAASFALDHAGRLGFFVKDYDHSLALTIDPVVSYTRIIGVTNTVSADAVAVDASGDLFVTGTSVATDYPVVGGSQPIASNGGQEVYLTKLDPTGSQILFSTFLPSPGINAATAITVDGTGNVYLAGVAGDSSFPTTSQNLGTCSPMSCHTGFVAKFSNTGSMIYSTMIGTGQQLPKGIVVDGQGNAYIAGLSSDAGLKTINAFQSSYTGGLCTSCGSPFFAELNPTGTAFVFASYFSGPHNSGLNAATYASSIARDAHGNIYLAGPGDGVPLQGSLQNGIGGSFAAEFGPDGKTLIFSTMLGGSTIEPDSLSGMQVGPDGTIYLAGSHIDQDFPYTATALMLPQYSIGYSQGKQYIDAIAINPAHTGFTYATYLGEGSVSSTAIDANGNFYVGGTYGLGSVPFKNAIVSDVGNSAFILELDPTGALVNSTAFGGYHIAVPPNGMAVDGSGNIYVAGVPERADTNVPSGSFVDPISVGTGSYSQQAGLGQDTSSAQLATVLTKISPATNQPQVSLSYRGPVLALRNAGSADLHISSLQVGGTFTKANTTCGATVPAGTGCFLTPNNSTGNATTGTVTINSDAVPATQTFNPAPSSTGVSTNVSLFVDTSRLSFPPEANGETSPTRPMKIWNTGLTTTTIQSILTFGYFSQTNNCGALAPQTFCTVQLSVTPVSNGTPSGDIGIVYLVGGNPIRTDVLASFTQNPTDGPILLSANALNYGNVLSGQSSIIRTLTVTNTGNSPVSVAAPSITGTGAASFVIAGNSCSGASLQPQQSCVVSVEFQPSSAGLVSVPMTISGGGYSNSVRLGGTGVTAPSVSITPNSAAFGNILLGTSANQVFQVTNTGSASETISNIVATLADTSFSTEYAEMDTCQAALAPLATCSITVTLTPQSAGPRNGALHFSVNGGIVSQSVALTATAITAFSANPGAVDFGSLLAGGPGKTVPVVFTNQTAASQPFSMTVGSGFQISSTSCVSPLAAGAQCTASITFQPANPGPLQAALTVTFANSPAPLTVNLSGVGVTTPTIQFSVANHVYGDPPFTVAATSNSTGAISYSVVSGPASISGSTVTLQGTGTVVLQASQAAAGNYAAGTQNATFTVASAPPDFSISANVSSLTIKQGQSGTATFTVTPLNGFNATVTFACSGLPSGASCSFSPASVTPNGGPVTDQLTVATLGPTVAVNRKDVTRPSFWRTGGSGMTIAIGSILFVLPFGRRRGKWKGLAVWIVLLGVSLLPALGCGGSPQQTGTGTPIGTSQVTVNAIQGTGSGAQQHNVVLTVTVTN